MKWLKRILVQMAIGANVMAALLLLACSLCSGLNPAEYPRAAIFVLGFPLLLLLNLAFVFFWLVFSIRHVWIPFAGMLFSVSYIYDYCPVNWPSGIPDGALKVITYNTEFMGARGKSDDGHYPLLEYLASSDADIICIQEGVPQSKGPSVAYEDSVMEAAGYHILRLNDGKAEPQFIYSRLPVLSVRRISYESSANGSVAAELLYGEDTVLVVNNHFESYKLTREDKEKYKEIIKEPEKEDTESNSRALFRKMAVASSLRGPQADSVLHYIHASGHEAVVVCGDFNEPPVSYSCYRMGTELASAFRQSGNGLGLSYNQKGFYFRIDHIFVSDYWRTYDTHVDKSATWSDHYPLVTYLKKHKK